MKNDTKISAPYLKTRLAIGALLFVVFAAIAWACGAIFGGPVLDDNHRQQTIKNERYEVGI